MGRLLLVMAEGWTDQERIVWACVNEKGWGLVVGECSKGMSGKARIPQGSFRGLCGIVGEPNTMHGCAIVRETPLSTTAIEIKKGEDNDPSSTSSHSGSYVTLNRPGPHLNNNQSCLKSVCCLLVACWSGVYWTLAAGGDYAQQFITAVRKTL